MRVLLIVNTLPPRDLSGAGEQVAQLAWALRQAGQEVEILGRGAGGACGSKLLFPVTAVLPALRRLRALRPDVVQVHESDGGLVLAALRARRGSGAGPLLCALQQVSYREEARAVRSVRDVSTGRVVARPTWREWIFRWFRAPLHVALGRFTARRCDLLFAPSARTAGELCRDYGVGAAVTLPNVTGAPLPGRDSIETSFGPPGARFLYVGRLRVRKGVEVLLEALAHLGDTAPAIAIDIVGDGERSRPLQRLAHRLGLADRVRFLGRLGAGEIRVLLEGCRALVVPSLYEGMPLVVLEAMEASRAVVASAVSGIPEVVIDGETGWLVPPEQVDALAAALLEAWRQPEEAERRGRNGRDRLDQRYRPRHGAETWLAAVQSRMRMGGLGTAGGET
ncbi:MAG TPA: glycosyltransferase family 4 protein [Thermoanaerobaculia bacterium]|nr:glycosyltransferase family 4 protein [Thermoanaerobaculia bacterium]